MTYQEAQQKSLTVKWKTVVCNQGEECWCRMIEPENKIEYDDGEQIYIVGSGDLSKIYAEHFVNLHNASLNVC